MSTNINWVESRSLEEALSLACVQDSDSFPPISGGYYDRYTQISNYLLEHFHNNVNTGAAVQGDGFLTEHGLPHINAVIRNARSLIINDDEHILLTSYEVFILLCSIHLHDAGNVFGRREHEKKIKEIMVQMGNIAGDDDLEKKIIVMIAQAHGGFFNGDKDTISNLTRNEMVQSVEIRVHLLSAILRFADELSDDRTRAARVLSAMGIIPRKSEIFHKYSEVLNSAKIDLSNSKIVLEYVLNKDNCVGKYWKGRRKEFLLDEIFQRTMKMHLERVYCSRFFSPYINIDKVNVRIRIFRHIVTDMRPIEEIEYSLEEFGYPTDEKSIREICGDSVVYNGSLTRYKGEVWNGQILKKVLEAQK